MGLVTIGGGMINGNWELEWLKKRWDGKWKMRTCNKLKSLEEDGPINGEMRYL